MVPVTTDDAGTAPNVPVLVTNTEPFISAYARWLPLDGWNMANEAATFADIFVHVAPLSFD